jgi:hypothetical protein
MCTKFYLENLKGEATGGGLGLVGRIILKYIIGQINLAQDRVQWQALMNIVMNLQIL